MSGWLLAVSRDADLVQAIHRANFRVGMNQQLWAVESAARARSCLSGKSKMPAVIVLDELFLRGESPLSAAAEFAWFAPVIVIAKPSCHTRLAPLVAAGKIDCVPRDDHHIPLTTALVERALRREQAAHERVLRIRPQSANAPTEPFDNPAALRLVGGILDHLERVFAERSRLTHATAARLDRLTDLAFDLKQILRRDFSAPDQEPEPVLFP